PPCSPVFPYTSLFRSRFAVDRAVAEELRGGEGRDHPEHAALLAGAEPRLEPDDVPHLARAVLAPELDHGVRRTAGPRVAEPDGLDRKSTRLNSSHVKI